MWGSLRTMSKQKIISCNIHYHEEFNQNFIKCIVSNIIVILFKTQAKYQTPVLESYN